MSRLFIPSNRDQIIIAAYKQIDTCSAKGKIKEALNIIIELPQKIFNETRLHISDEDSLDLINIEINVYISGIKFLVKKAKDTYKKEPKKSKEYLIEAKKFFNKFKNKFKNYKNEETELTKLLEKSI